ncbi:Mannosyl phosphorylinositol ceramide synthase CSH1 [Cyphellophora attinorum]|uniref:Mannosyl phosphorylinositol ceramide synthase CSH1 n=1 Tax=Cyphellophora attinorum TaxID=1664694 RepID=A0A0N1P161_9EURO|nr:Mannosyl phosphorylinositol ceramide synthase CSH1 [Phialophora attinorum]KPI41573.1 Mannosyl phosphorylinositol ceramide synthase CSH1 [Phialophora attinorum]
MRRSAIIFLVVFACVLIFLTHEVWTLITLLFEDAALDAIPLSELPAWDNTTDPTTPLTGWPEQIPKIIHQTYKNATIPDRWLEAQQSCIALHQPDYEYHLWSDAESLSFIAEHYAWFLPTFSGYSHPIQRADAIRYFVLRKYGGIYIDLDDGCARRLDPLLQYQAFVRRTIPTGISNDVMGSVPNHPFFVRVTESLQGADRSWILPYITIMASTGPLFLSVIWKKWLNEHAGLAPDGGEWEGRVRVLMPNEYSTEKAERAWFNTFKGDSWHEGDAKFIFWLGKNWILVTAIGFAIGIFIAVMIWVMLNRRGGKSGSPMPTLKRRTTAPSRSRNMTSSELDDEVSDGSENISVAWATQPPTGSSSQPQYHERKVPWWRRTPVLRDIMGKGPYEMYDRVEQHDA